MKSTNAKVSEVSIALTTANLGKSISKVRLKRQKNHKLCFKPFERFKSNFDLGVGNTLLSSAFEVLLLNEFVSYTHCLTVPTQ